MIFVEEVKEADVTMCEHSTGPNQLSVMSSLWSDIPMARDYSFS